MRLAEVKFGIMSVDDSVNLEAVYKRFKHYDYQGVGYSKLWGKMIPLRENHVDILECTKSGDSYYKDGEKVDYSKIVEIDDTLLYLNTKETFLVDLDKLFACGYKGELHILRIFDMQNGEAIGCES
nr:MAG TPA: hypothetical protein [Caudoviricetes sp.]